MPGRQVIDMEKQKIQQEGRLLMESNRIRGFTGVLQENIQLEIEQDRNSLEKFYQGKVKKRVFPTYVTII